MRAKLSSNLKLVFALVLFSTSCRGNSRESTSVDAGPSLPQSSASPAATSTISPFAPLIGAPALRALEAVSKITSRLQAGTVSPDNLDYVDLRRSLSAGAPLWRRREMLAGEVIFGPPKSIDESGGALARLDAALVHTNVSVARESLETIAAPLRLFAETSKTLALSPSVIAQTLSNSAYDLGALALESTPSVPDGLSAVLADAQGTLDFIENGSRFLAQMSAANTTETLAAAMTDCAMLRKRLDEATSSRVFQDRASFVVLTGKLGVSLRRLARAVGVETRPPYRPRRMNAANDNEESISALTIPARNFATDDPETMAYVELGRTLFFDKRLSVRRVRACVSCHVPEKGLADGTNRPKSLEPNVTLRHTPSLLYGSLQAAYLWDGRVLTAERQALGVIHAKAEMGLADEDIVRNVEGADDLRPLIAALGTSTITPEVIARALAAFQAHEFVPADAPIDRYARGDVDALSPNARAGLDVFAGRGRCARCHVPPFFGGSRPRDFTVPIFATLGVPTTPEGKTLDPDLGRGSVTHREGDAHAFKTPTTRNVLRTAPYFHHGAFRTLEQVVDFYDRGGGRGLGLSVPRQDPDVRKLDLSSNEKVLLLEFLRVALLDATPPEKLVLKRMTTK